MLIVLPEFLPDVGMNKMPKETGMEIHRTLAKF
jgi:hypothetical protein